ncbi:hypothetical protein SAMN02745121_06078 [Nannocystis exedens]|uniref:DUF1993 domain-containing protein n=1 Tax=Nannocystis exedens TaxID=54 RepID=A0A1I2EHB5_9BACT|nr:DUF1993 domain-containing protein [Nannocystis exedens]PCC74742.1 hypothetical protein NAEX_07841 [Nannocystis exedens]SFE91650.1 hypothetical protein SAMN02745121_06078 [Nannocystis exedens]
MNLFDISIPHMSRTVGQVPVWLDKAQAHADQRKFDVNVLLTARLAPDQWHFTRQIQAVVFGPLRLANVLRGQAPPDLLELEPTVAAVRACVAETREKLDRLRSEDFAGAEARVIPLPFLPGKGLQAPDFVQQFALPNFYFHAVTAYSILRHNGVDVGKSDFLAPLAIRDL